MTDAPDADAAAVFVKTFYDMVAAGRGDDVAALVEKGFAPDASLSRPESLPGGGLVSGANRIAKFMRLAAPAVSGLQLRSVHVCQAAEEINVFAELQLALGDTTTTALEWWTIRAAQVTSLKAFYWDTAAIIAAAKP
jgi:hypothetical protein